LNYLFHTKQLKRYFEYNAGGSGQRCSLAIDNIKSIPLDLPDIDTQHRIAAVLSCLDEKIALNNRINDNLEAMAKAIYEYWFVQNADEKWERKTIRDIAETGSGGTPLSTNKEYYENGTIPWINSSELNFGYIITTSNYITENGLNNSSAKLFPSNSLLIALYGATAGKVSLLKIPATTNQAICAIMPFSITYTNYLKYHLSDLYKYLVIVSSGSARDNLSQELIRNLNISLPYDSILEQFNEVVNPIINKIVLNINENLHLTTLRDYLLPLLMNGQVSVNYHLSEERRRYDVER
jgi:type I restriction enzyme S subunit